MTKSVSILLLLLWACAAGAAAPLRLTLPSADSYCYWVQSASGPVSAMPVTVTHKKAVAIAASVAAGDRVFVLDAHTGGMASKIVSVGAGGMPSPIMLALSDFGPTSAPQPAVPVSAAHSSTPAPPAPDSPAARVLTGLFSLVLAGGVGWLVWHLVKTRGEPLRNLARRAGVEVADPAALTAEADAALSEPPTYASARRAPETVPEEAGLPPSDMVLSQNHSSQNHSSQNHVPPSGLPLTSKIGRGPELPLSEIPALLGLQGLAAGSTFALSGGDVTVGRDGDNEIVLAENTVSRRHARLLRDAHGQFTLTDLGSANGVYLNGERVQRAILNSGDEIKIGDNYFRFQAAKGNS